MTLRLSATGTRVEVSPPRADDVVPYGLAVQASAERLERWNSVDPGDLERHIRAQSDSHRTFLVRALNAERSHGIVGRINLTNVVRGRFCSGTLGSASAGASSPLCRTAPEAGSRRRVDYRRNQ